MKERFKQFFRIFGVMLVIAAILPFIVSALYKQGLNAYYDSFYESPNTERKYSTQRVFDYGNRLSEKEESALEAHIRVKERETCTDIVIVLLEESLEGFAQDYYRRYGVGEVPADQWVRLYADDFWEINRFGYDKPQVLDGKSDSGDGVCLVDNNFREPASGKKHTWMCTTGKVYSYFDDDEINDVLDIFYENVDDDLFKACMDFVDAYASRIGDYPPSVEYFNIVTAIIALVIAIIFMVINLSTKVGSKTTDKGSYVGEKGVDFYDNQDIFLRKTVTSHVIETESRSGGGGGGGHVSGGGGFHGGGGHSR